MTMECDQPITVTITRTVKRGSEPVFEKALREFIPQGLAFPGHLGVHVHKPMSGTSRTYIVLIKFQSVAQWEAFKTWPVYQVWQERVHAFLEVPPKVEEQCGLESWFYLPGQQISAPLPRWKMALVTWVAVYPTSLLMNFLLRPFIKGWPLPFAVLVVSLCLVCALTWVVMPAVTRSLHRWLYPQDVEREETRVEQA